LAQNQEEIMRPTRRLLLSALPAAALIGRAQAQSPIPDRPVRYIVPFPPGGLTDIMARLVAQKLSDIWAKPVIIENRAGGNALIGADAAAKSPADGYTLLAITMTHTVNASLFPADLLTQTRERNLNAGSSGNGSPPHLGLELVRRVSGAGDRITHVPYRGGAPSVTDLAAGNLDFMVSNLPECIAQIQGGRLRPLAITSASRHPLVPDVPTVREAGSPELEMTNWTAMMTNAAVPAPVLAKLEADTLAAIRDAEVSRRAREGGFTVEAWDRARSAAYISAETDRWARLVQEAKLKAD